jgi:hypothetical protein
MFKKIGCIKNLEVASICNLACPYCPCSGQGQYREVGLMGEETFDRSMFWLEKFVRAGTQRELNLFGIGEPSLHIRYLEMVRRCREIMPLTLTLRLNTNGILATEEWIESVILAGADALDLTDHDAVASTRTLQSFHRLGQKYPDFKFGYSRDGVTNPNNWGGLIDWVPVVQHGRVPCPWLLNGQVMIMSNGDVTRCCQDAHARGLLGTIWLDDLDQIDHTPFIQCNTCHEIVPPGMPRSELNTNPMFQKEKIA